METTVIDPKMAASIHEHQRLMRKPSAGVSVRNAVIQNVDGGAGVIVQTVRSNRTDELLASETYQLTEVETNGLPLPDLTDLGNI